MSERNEEDVKEKDRKRNKSPRAKQFQGRSGRWLFLLLILMQNWFCVDAAATFKPKGEAEVPEIIIVSDAVEGTFVNLDGESLQKEQKEKYERVKADKGRQDIDVRIAEWFGLRHRKEENEKIQRHF